MSEKKKKNRVGSIIFRIVLIVIAGLTVGLGVFSWNASGLLGNELPMPFGFGISVVMSPSMEPELHTNDLVIVAKADSYDVGDIVVYQEGKMLIIHRIVNIDGDNVITKGDANNTADEPIELADIKAKYNFRIPFVGLIFKYIKTVPGTLLILILAIFLLYRSRRKEREVDQKELDNIVEEINRLRALQNESENAPTDDVSGQSSEKTTEANASESAEAAAPGAKENTESAEDEKVAAEESTGSPDEVTAAEEDAESVEKEKDAEAGSDSTPQENSEDTSDAPVREEPKGIAEANTIPEEMSK